MKIFLILESSPSNQFSSAKDVEHKSTNDEAEGKLTPLVLAEHILSKSNLEKLFDRLSKRPILVANGCDFLITVLDLLGRYMPAPICISTKSFIEGKPELKDQSSLSDKDENERMQVKKRILFLLNKLTKFIFKINHQMERM
jgi:hypothetical protein